MSTRAAIALGLALVGVVVAGCGGGGGGGGGGSHQISGTVTSSGAAVQGTTVYLDGARSLTAETDATGKYSFSALPDGDYMVTPAYAGYSCIPRGKALTLQGTDITAADFEAKQSSPVVYVVDDNHKLGTVNLTTGEVNLVGDTGVVLTDIAFDPNGILYGITANGLYRVNINSAFSTKVGDLNLTDATSLIFSNCGNTLYTADQFLRTVNSSTAVTTRIGDIGFSGYPSSGDLAFIGNTVYLTSKADLTNNYLVRLNTATGAGAPVGLIGFPHVFGMVSNDNVNLYGFSRTNVIRINPATGAGTQLHDITGKGLGNINGAAYYYFQ